MNTAIEIKNLSFRYPNSKINTLNNLSLKIPEGKITLIMGKSGCGKSTMALSLTGIIPKSIEGDLSGDILLKGKSIKGHSPGELSTKIGIVFQDPESQFCTFTVEDEIAFGLENLKLSKEEINNRINEVLELVNMKEFRNKQLNMLSGGEKQKIAICSILSLGAEIIILDEPTANLDPKTTIDIFNLLIYLRDVLGKTIIIIEHKLDYLLSKVDNVILLSTNGEIEFSGSIENFYYRLNQIKSKELSWLSEIGILSRKLREKNKNINFFITHDQAVNEVMQNINRFANNINYKDKLYNTSEPIIKINNLSYSYDNKTKAIDNISLNVYSGEFLAIAGSNGAGKSTLSKILMGLYKNFEGEVLIYNKKINLYNKKELVKKIGLVFQNPEHQFISNTVYEELLYSLKLDKLDKKLAENKINKYLDMFNLNSLKYHNPFQLSQGQKRRLSVASMLIRDQKIIILDEPTYGQDSENTERLMEYMKILNNSGLTIIIITHDMSLIANYCSRVILLDKGKKIYDNKTINLFKDNNVIKAASIDIPPIVRLSLSIKEYYPKFPFLININDYLDSIKVER